LGDAIHLHTVILVLHIWEEKPVHVMSYPWPPHACMLWISAPVLPLSHQGWAEQLCIQARYGRVCRLAAWAHPKKHVTSFLDEAGTSCGGKHQKAAFKQLFVTRAAFPHCVYMTRMQQEP